MTDWQFEPCSEWAEKLAMTHSNDLLPSDANALEDHLKNCSVCEKARAEYLTTGQLIRNLSEVNDASSELPSWLQRLVDRQVRTGRGGSSLVQKAFCTRSVSRTQTVTRATHREVE